MQTCDWLMGSWSSTKWDMSVLPYPSRGRHRNNYLICSEKLMVSNLWGDNHSPCIARHSIYWASDLSASLPSTLGCKRYDRSRCHTCQSHTVLWGIPSPYQCTLLWWRNWIQLQWTVVVQFCNGTVPGRHWWLGIGCLHKFFNLVCTRF